ncbi:MAG: gluconate 2-dehydrogenase subunit 3 family protein [Daejeonella sp.]
MERREAIRNATLLFGGAITASTFSVLFESCNRTEIQGDDEILFSSDQQLLITEIADIIIPQTTTPGAKAAGVGPFITMMIKECYPEEVQKSFVEGLQNVDKLAKSKFQSIFVDLKLEDRNAIIREIADETIKFRKTDKDREKAEAEKTNNRINSNNNQPVKPGKTYFFALIRELTIMGYFTSELGSTKALAYLPIPGKFDACVDLKPGQKTWAL